MATATVVTLVSSEVTLILTGPEASVLVKLFTEVGGDPGPGHPRHLVDGITRALRGAGVSSSDDSTRGSVYIDSGDWRGDGE